MNNEWRSAEWVSGQVIETKPTMLGVLRLYAISLLGPPLKVIAALLLFVLMCALTAGAFVLVEYLFQLILPSGPYHDPFG